MDFQLEKFHRNISKEELLEDLIRVSKILNKNTVTSREYEKYGKYSKKPFTNRFGSWAKTLKTVNFDISMDKNISIEDLFQNLYNVWKKLGRQPSQREMIKPLSKYSGKPYVTKFGNWCSALEKFIEYINNPSNLDDKDMDNKREQLISSSNSENNEFIHKTKREPNWRLRFLVMKRDDFKCKICGRSPANESGVILHIDHIKPWNKGGETVLENLQTLCSVCNIGKSNLV